MTPSLARAGGCLAGLLVCAALAAPWLGLRDPAAQPDGLVLRELRPWTHASAVRLADGELRYVHAWRETPQGIEIRRGEHLSTFAREDLAGPTRRDWSRRPLFVLGTDAFGRDVFARLVFGARFSLAIGLLAATMALGLGTLVGTLAAMLGGLVDAVLMRMTDVVLAVPRLFLAMMLIALHGHTVGTTIVVLGITSWMTTARLVRGEILALRESEFVQAARAAGVPRWRLAWSHLLPSATRPLWVEGMLRVGDTILVEASLSYLGLGVPAPQPSWGNMIAEGRDRLLDAWWIATFPGLAIVATVAALHLVGEAARKRLDPATCAPEGW